MKDKKNDKKNNEKSATKDREFDLKQKVGLDLQEAFAKNNKVLEDLQKSMNRALEPINERNRQLMKSFNPTQKALEPYMEISKRITKSIKDSMMAMQSNWSQDMTNLSKTITDSITPMQSENFLRAVENINATLKIPGENLVFAKTQFLETIQEAVIPISKSLLETIDLSSISESIEKELSESNAGSELSNYLYENWWDEVFKGTDDQKVDDNSQVANNDNTKGNRLYEIDQRLTRKWFPFYPFIRAVITHVLMAAIMTGRPVQYITNLFNPIEYSNLVIYSHESEYHRISANIDTVIRTEPNAQSETLSILQQDGVAWVLENVNYYYKVSYINEEGEEIVGYIAKRNVSLIDKPE